VFAFTTQSIAGAALYMVNHGIATGLLFLVIGMLTVRGGSKLVGDYGGVWKVAPILGGFFFIAALATIAMPGTNSFISEFLVLIGTFSRHPAWAVLATIGIVLAAVYMLWIFQRTMTGPVRGAAVVGGRGPEDIQEFLPPDPGDLPRDPSGGPEPAVEPVPVGVAAAGGQPGMVGPAAHPEPAGHGTRAKVKALFGDLNAREITVLTPLVLLIVLLGVYPQPVIDVINPTAERTMVDVGYTDPVPAIDAPLGGGQ
jgi:NADH-quinone oxidoreductase subunit M